MFTVLQYSTTAAAIGILKSYRTQDRLTSTWSR